MRDLYEEYEKDDIELVAVADIDYFSDTPAINIESICGVDICAGFEDIDYFDDGREIRHHHPLERRY